MDTETPTPTPTETPTITPTATETPTPTLEIYIEVTTEAGLGARIAREVSVGDIWISVLLFAIFVSLWVMYLLTRLRGGKL
jgi:hypothetical protein